MLDDVEDDDEEGIEAARQEVAAEVADAANASLRSQGQPAATTSPRPTRTSSRRSWSESSSGRSAAVCPIPATPRRTSSTWPAMKGISPSASTTDGSPGEIFIRMAKEGSTIGGLMDTIATLVSVSLQYGVPVESLVRKFEHVRFEPSGMTRNPEIPFAKSLVDYIFRWLAMEFVHGYRAANAPKREARPDNRRSRAGHRNARAGKKAATATARASKPIPLAPSHTTSRK